MHGDFDGTDAHAVGRAASPLSVLCAAPAGALRLSSPPGLPMTSPRPSGRGAAAGRTACLVFFCGCRLARGGCSGGGAVTMARSLIAQLLRQFPAGRIELDPGLR